MRSAKLVVKKTSAQAAEKTPWLLDLRVDGKRVRRYFASERAANEELTRIRIKRRKEGEDALKLTDPQRVQAYEAFQRLEGSGMTLLEAVDYTLKHLETTKRSVTVRALVDEYLASKSRKSAIHQKDLRNRYERFAATFGTRFVHEVTSKEIAAWIQAKNPSPVSFNNWRERIGFLFGHAIRKGYMGSTNPIEAVEKEEPFDEKPEIFTVDDLAKLLNAATPELVPILALGAFTGIRMAELMRLEWKEVNFHTGFVEVMGRKAKSRSHRSVEMHPNLLAWLAPYAGRTGCIWNGTENTFRYFLRPILKATGVKWAKNGLRHSYASYHLQKYNNVNKLALDLGHTSSDLIFSNYRALANKTDAERYFGITPPAPVEHRLHVGGSLKLGKSERLYLYR